MTDQASNIHGIINDASFSPEKNSEVAQTLTLNDKWKLKLSLNKTKSKK
jgi:hypothetical protein